SELWMQHEHQNALLASFRGTVQHGLPLEIGDTVQILEKCEGTLHTGIFPCSYIHLKNAVVKNKGQFETVMPVEDSVITEMTSTLREWGAMWKQLYVKNEGDLFHRLWHVMNEILDLRRQVLVGHLTHDRMKDVKQHITARLDWGNEQLCLDLVPRREFSMVDPDEISVTELYRLIVEGPSLQWFSTCLSVGLQSFALCFTDTVDFLFFFTSRSGLSSGLPLMHFTKRAGPIPIKLYRVQFEQKSIQLNHNAVQLYGHHQIPLCTIQINPTYHRLLCVCFSVFSRDLIKVLKWYVDRIVEAEHQDHIQQVLKASDYIFKYIIQSRRLFSLATGGQNEEEFRACILELFMSIRFFLSQESKGISPVTQTQAVFLRTFPAIYSELLKFFTVRDVAGFVRETLASLPTVVQADSPLEAVKLQCISKTVESQLYINPESRCILLPVVLRVLHTCLQEQRDLVMCARIFTSMLSLIKKEDNGTVVNKNTSTKEKSCVSLLFDVIHITCETFEPSVFGFCPVILSVLLNWLYIFFLFLFFSSSQVEAKLIDKLDSLMSEGKGDETYRELFNSIIPLFGPYPSLLKKIERETWRESGISLIATVTRLMERLLDYRDCMKLGEVDGKKIGCTVSLLNFYKTELNKEEMYIRYIHKLYDLHLKAQNYTEASYTLLLYDELLEWSDRPLREFLNYPMQSEWQRKEYLHLTIIQNFDRGKCWENGIILCRELADQYESYYDYRNLSKMRMMEASLYDKIMDQQRLEPEFFRVGFYGKKFPFFLRNKEFVCRGHDYERLEAFQQRMLNEFPHAIAMQHVNQPDQTIYQADAQYLQIYAVTPIPESQDVLQRDGVPDNIKSFYKFNHIWKFRYDRPFHKGTKDKENEFKSLWVERTTLTLVQSLPGISRWFEVEKRELVEVSPLENAIEVIENKNLQLRTLITQCQNRQMQNINPLTMCLNGVIDAAVNGGLARYQEAFFVKDYIMNHPEDGDKIGRLRELMFEQAHILEYGLAVHEKYVPQDMRPLHKKLVDQFHLMKSSLGIQEFPAYVRASPVPFTNGSPRTYRNSVPSIISPDAGRGVARRSPCSYPAVNRYSSSSLSSQASNEVSNITGQSESSDEVFNMQPSPSTSSLSSNHSASPNVTSSAPSSARGSPQMAEKHKHSRENACLSPRERPVSAIFSNPLEPAQVGKYKLRPTPSSWSLDSVKERAPSFSDNVSKPICPPIPPRPQHPVNILCVLVLPQTAMPPFTPSPTECQSTSLVSNSPVLSGSYSSGISSLSRCSVSEASGTELPAGDHLPHPLPPPAPLPNSISSGSDEPIRRENKTPPPYSVYERNNPRRPVPLPHSLSIPPQTDPPALPPKPHQIRTGSMKLDGNADPRVPRPRPLPRKVSQL
uniref:Dedicator of cytokinesis 4b n=1 Tax=Xiphophorus couchianus TaxID=32473 RepID=A0A3B5M6F2_9TELE